MNNFINKYQVFIFLSLVVLVVVFLNYHEILFLRPQSVHSWRQCDNLSITLNYYQFDLSLFNPRLHHLYGNEGRTVGEFPIYYYLTAQLYYLMGEREFILRLLHLGTFFIGLFYLYKTALLFTKDSLFSILVPFTFFCSIILAYYANNFISDAPAFGLVLISWYYFSKYYFSNNIKTLIIALIIITIAGLVKVTSFITPAVFGLLLLKEYKTRNFKPILLFSIPIIIILAWVLFTYLYKQKHDNFYLIMKIKPIWKYTFEHIQVVWDRLCSSGWGWKDAIISPLLLYPVLCSSAVIFIIKVDSRIKFVIGIALLLCVMYFLLFYPQFYHHDYYLVHIIPYLFIPFIIVIWWIGNKLNFQYFSPILLATCISYGTFHTKKGLKARYNQPFEFSYFHDLQPQLAKLGLDKNTKVINISDNTYCISLYLMNKQGWTNLNIKKGERRQFIIDPKHMDWNTSDYISSEIDVRIAKGAEYLFVNTNDEKIAYIPDSYLKNMIFEDSDIKIFKIQ